MELTIERLADGEVSPYFHDILVVGDRSRCAARRVATSCGRRRPTRPPGRGRIGGGPADGDAAAPARTTPDRRCGSPDRSGPSTTSSTRRGLGAGRRAQRHAAATRPAPAHRAHRRRRYSRARRNRRERPAGPTASSRRRPGLLLDLRLEPSCIRPRSGSGPRASLPRVQVIQPRRRPPDRPQRPRWLRREDLGLRQPLRCEIGDGTPDRHVRGDPGAAAGSAGAAGSSRIASCARA